MKAKVVVKKRFDDDMGVMNENLKSIAENQLQLYQQQFRMIQLLTNIAQNQNRNFERCPFPHTCTM